MFYLFLQTVMLVVSVLTLGIVRLILHWNPEWLVKCTANKCPLSVCDHVLVKLVVFSVYFKKFF